MKSRRNKGINPYRWLNKNKKIIVSTISLLIVASLLFGVFAQLLYIYTTY